MPKKYSRPVPTVVVRRPPNTPREVRDRPRSTLSRLDRAGARRR